MSSSVSECQAGQSHWPRVFGKFWFLGFSVGDFKQTCYFNQNASYRYLRVCGTDWQNICWTIYPSRTKRETQREYALRLFRGRVQNTHTHFDYVHKQTLPLCFPAPPPLPVSSYAANGPCLRPDAFPVPLSVTKSIEN